jgi:hypothetical protein
MGDPFDMDDTDWGRKITGALETIRSTGDRRHNENLEKFSGIDRRIGEMEKREEARTVLLTENTRLTREAADGIIALRAVGANVTASLAESAIDRQDLRAKIGEVKSDTAGLVAFGKAANAMHALVKWMIPFVLFLTSCLALWIWYRTGTLPK